MARGEIVALLGPSGSGKTTVLRLLAGFELPDAGRIAIEGEDVTALPPARRRCGMVFQHYALFPHLDVGENVGFGLDRLDRHDRDRKVAASLELVDLAGFERRKPDELSGGQQQRVALARALAPEPRVLLLDEPLSNLDPALRERTRRELRALIKRVGITTVFVTHEQEEAFDLGDRVAVLDRGRLEQVGAPEDLYERPASLFVATFVGRANVVQGATARALGGRDGQVVVVRPEQGGGLGASVWISLASVALAAAIGVPLAFLFEWLEFPGRKTLGSLIALPAVLPPFVGVIAFLFLYGESGFVARAVQAVLGLTRPPWRLQGAGAILLVHAYSMYVYFYLLARAGLAKLDASLIEAAQALGAGRWDTLSRVTLPLLRPALGGAGLLVFMAALGSFSAPDVFGGGFLGMTPQIVATEVNGELPLALVETVALALVAVVGFAVLRRTEGNDPLIALGKGTAPRRRPIRRPGVRGLATAAGWLFAVLLLLPHLTLALVSLVPYGSWTTETLPPVLSLVNYQRLFGEPERLRPLVNSLWMATLSTFAALALALPPGALIGRRRPREAAGRFRGAIETLVALPWALPGAVFAIALAAAFSVSSPITLRWGLVGTVGLLPLAYLVRNLPVTRRAWLAGYPQLDA